MHFAAPGGFGGDCGSIASIRSGCGAADGLGGGQGSNGGNVEIILSGTDGFIFDIELAVFFPACGGEK